MSDKPIKLTKKQLKASAFRTRKKVKAVLEEPAPFPEDEVEQETPLPPPTKRSIKDKIISKSKPIKRKRDEDQHSSGSEDDHPTEEAEDVTGAAAKRRKRKKAAQARKFEEDKAAKASKLILFVGNLPFDITTERLKAFFLEHCEETPEVRLMTPKLSPNEVSSQTKFSKPTKGCGFIEFKSSAALQKALRLHQTPISCETNGQENQKKSRKINIELTAGGGGKSESRLKKIEVSKERLNKQRDKRLEKNLKEITEKRLKYGLEAGEEDVTVEFGRKKKNVEASVPEEGKANWGSKGKSEGAVTRPTASKPLRSFKGKPQMSGANAIRLA